MSRRIQPELLLWCGPERCDDCAFLEQGKRRLSGVPWHCGLPPIHRRKTFVWQDPATSA